MAKVLLKKSSVSDNAPGTGDLEYGELALNYADGRLYYKNSSNQIKGFIDSAGVESVLAGYVPPLAELPAHDDLEGFVANEHIDHSTVTLTAGSGLTGGGDITTSRTFNIGAGTGITVNADNIAIGQDVSTTSDVTFAKVTSDSASVDNISFRIRTTAPNDAAGTLYFDSDEQQSLSLKLRTLENPTPGVTLNVGQENLLYVHNLSGANILNGKAVYVSGTAHGKHPQISLSKADTSATGQIAGLTTMDIPNGGHGWVTTSGMVRGLDTSLFTTGDVLYLSKDSAGELVNTGVSVDDGYPVHAARVMTVDSSEGMVLVEVFSEHFEYLRVQDRIRVDGRINMDSAVASEVATGLIDLTPTDPGPAWKEGRLYYNDEYKALTVYNDEADISLQVGQEEWVRVYNNSGSAIPDGRPVYATGSLGETLTIAPADATTETKARVVGLATHTIENSSYGYVTVRGLVSGFDTSAIAAGQPIHLAADGSLQNTAATYPYFPVEIGACVVSDSSGGYVYVNVDWHHSEQLRVSGNAHIDGNLTVDGDLTVNGTQSIVSQANLAVDNSFIYLNSGNTIGSANTNFTGSGLDDAYFTGHYEGTTTQTFYVRIDGVGTGSGGVDTFEWSLDNFSTTEATDVDITGDDQALADGISIFFNATTGHTSADKWDGQAAPVNTDTGWFTNRNTGTTGVGYTHLGIYFDVSDGIFKVVDEYAPEPNGSIDDGDASYSLGTFKADTFQGNLTGNVAGNVTGNATSSTVLATSRNIAISGDITASGVAFNGSSNITLSAAITAGSIVNADINASAAIADTKLNTISSVGKVQNSATSATSANTSSSIVARNASGNFSAGTITAALTGNASTASALATARAIALTGDVTGSANFDGSGNISITATVGDDTHNHVISNVDGLQTALDAKLPLAGGTMSGNLTFGSSADINLGSGSQINVGVSGEDNYVFAFAPSTNFGLTFNTAAGNPAGGSYDFKNGTGAQIFVIPANSGRGAQFKYDGNVIFTDGYHPNADKWTTARTITLGGDLSGNVSIDGSANVTLTATVNDGSGSGLDADLLDGQQGSYYRIDVYNAAGTLLN